MHRLAEGAFLLHSPLVQEQRFAVLLVGDTRGEVRVWKVW